MNPKNIKSKVKESVEFITELAVNQVNSSNLSWSIINQEFKQLKELGYEPKDLFSSLKLRMIYLNSRRGLVRNVLESSSNDIETLIPFLNNLDKVEVSNFNSTRYDSTLNNYIQEKLDSIKGLNRILDLKLSRKDIQISAQDLQRKYFEQLEKAILSSKEDSYYKFEENLSNGNNLGIITGIILDRNKTNSKAKYLQLKEAKKGALEGDYLKMYNGLKNATSFSMGNNMIIPQTLIKRVINSYTGDKKYLKSLRSEDFTTYGFIKGGIEHLVF